MKIILSMEINAEDLEKEIGKKYTKEEIKEDLTQVLFEVCEDWVLRGQQPDFEFKDEN